MKLEWHRAARRFETGSDLRLGGVVVASTAYDGISNRTEQPNRWKVTMHLPSLKPVKTQYAEEGEAKAEAERLVGVWIKAAGLTPTPPIERENE